MDEYYYEKLDLIRASEADITPRRTVEEIWLGLPADFQALLDYDEMMGKSVPNFGHALRTKDLSYREMRRRREDPLGRNGGSRRRNRGQEDEDRRDERRVRDERRREGNEKKREGRSKGSGELRDRNRNDTRKGDKRRNGEKEDLPPPLPRDKWRKDEKGRMMKRKCRFCDRWHMDFDCPSRPSSYNITAALDDQWHSSSENADASGQDGESEESSTEESDDGQPKRGWKTTKDIPMTYHNVFSNSPIDAAEMKLPRASHYRVEELPIAFSVGTRVSYLSAQPCPVKAWIGESPASNRSLQTGVVDSGGPSIIDRKMVPRSYTVMESPLKPVFGGIGSSRTPTRGYVVLPVYLPNAAAMSGDDRKARVAKLWIEFQVVDQCPAGFLIGVDAISAYKMAIDYPKLCVTLNAYDPPVRVPITDSGRYSTRRVDPRIFLAEPVRMRPFSEVWVPVRFTATDGQSDLLVTPVRHANVAEGTYASCSYAIISNDTSHLLMINPSPRPVKLGKDEIIGMFEPFSPNTPFSYFGAVAAAPTVMTGVAPTTVNPTVGLRDAVQMGTSSGITHTFHTAGQQVETPLSDGPLKDIVSTLDDPELTWHDGLDVPIDPFGLENEFRDTGPLLEPTVDLEPAIDKPNLSRTERRATRRAEDKSEARAQSAGKPAKETESPENGGSSSGSSEEPEPSLKWDICPNLPRKKRRMWIRMLEKHRKVFAGPEGRLGKVDSRFDMSIDADIKTIKSQQPYRTSPRKRKLIREAVEKLKELDVIQPSTSEVASPVIVVVQKGKPRFCVDLREINSKTAADRYALPKQDSVFRALAGAIRFSIVDANKGYYQFGMSLGSRRYTAFVTEDGFWEFRRVPFGLKNAPAHFQRSIDIILGSYRYEFALAFIDDIVIYSRNLFDHRTHVSLVLESLERVGMTVSEAKCHFAYENIELLGRRVGRLGLSTQEQKVKAIMALPYPTTIGEASEIFGQYNYHRDFIDNFAEIALSITKAMSPTKGKRNPKKPTVKMSPKEYAKLRSKTPYPDTPEIRHAFDTLKKCLSSAHVLVHPDFDKEFILYSDACRKGVAGSLYQVAEDGKEHPILFISHGLTDAETRYSATELECLAVVWCLHKLEHYVDGSKLKLYTDHSALKWIWDIKSTVNSRLFKWSLILNPLRDKVSIIHRPGRMHNNVDPLSRYPASYSVNLLHVENDWENRLWEGYLKDPNYRRILTRLAKKLDPDSAKEMTSPKSRDASTQTGQGGEVDELDRAEGVARPPGDKGVEEQKKEGRSSDVDRVGTRSPGDKGIENKEVGQGKEGRPLGDEGVEEDEEENKNARHPRDKGTEKEKKNGEDKPGEEKEKQENVAKTNEKEKVRPPDDEGVEVSRELEADRVSREADRVGRSTRGTGKTRVRKGKRKRVSYAVFSEESPVVDPALEEVERRKEDVTANGSEADRLGIGGEVDRPGSGEGEDGKDPLEGSLDEFYERTRDRQAL